MKAHEKREILAALDSGRKALLGALSGVTDDLAVRSPGLGKWSILQCVEHTAVSEDYLFSQLTAAKHSDMPMIDEQREALIMERGLDRAMRVESPEVGWPTGRFLTLTGAVQHFVAARERTIRFVRSSKDDLRSRVTSHPIIGTVNCYETLLMMVAHPHRHAEQLKEIRAALA
jgi:hypothetical protein